MTNQDTNLDLRIFLKKEKPRTKSLRVEEMARNDEQKGLSERED